MTWSNRFRLLGGLIAVVVVVAVATFRLNESKAQVASSAGQVSAESYTVGTPYSGVVVEQLVEVGSAVSTGDPLFLIDSVNLQRDVAQGAVPPRIVASDVDGNGYLVVRATGDGTVTAVEGEVGSFVRDATEVATVQRAGSVYVEAEFVLTPQEYARIEEQPRATVVLPGRREITGEVSEMTVEDQDGQARVVISIRSDELVVAEAEDRLVAVGTPVVARLHLNNDGVVSDIAAYVSALYQKVTS